MTRTAAPLGRPLWMAAYGLALWATVALHACLAHDSLAQPRSPLLELPASGLAASGPASGRSLTKRSPGSQMINYGHLFDGNAKSARLAAVSGRSLELEPDSPPQAAHKRRISKQRRLKSGARSLAANSGRKSRARAAKLSKARAMKASRLSQARSMRNRRAAPAPAPTNKTRPSSGTAHEHTADAHEHAADDHEHAGDAHLPSSGARHLFGVDLAKLPKEQQNQQQFQQQQAKSACNCNCASNEQRHEHFEKELDLPAVEKARSASLGIDESTDVPLSEGDATVKQLQAPAASIEDGPVGSELKLSGERNQPEKPVKPQVVKKTPEEEKEALLRTPSLLGGGPDKPRSEGDDEGDDEPESTQRVGINGASGSVAGMSGEFGPPSGGVDGNKGVERHGDAKQELAGALRNKGEALAGAINHKAEVKKEIFDELVEAKKAKKEALLDALATKQEKKKEFVGDLVEAKEEKKEALLDALAAKQEKKKEFVEDLVEAKEEKNEALLGALAAKQEKKKEFVEGLVEAKEEKAEAVVEAVQEAKEEKKEILEEIIEAKKQKFKPHPKPRPPPPPPHHPHPQPQPHPHPHPNPPHPHPEPPVYQPKPSAYAPTAAGHQLAHQYQPPQPYGPPTAGYAYPRRCHSKLQDLSAAIQELLELVERLGEKVLADTAVELASRDSITRKIAKIKAAGEESLAALKLGKLRLLSQVAKTAGLELVRLAHLKEAALLEPLVKRHSAKYRRVYGLYRKGCKGHY